jgi:hypothetical protein
MVAREVNRYGNKPRSEGAGLPGTTGRPRAEIEAGFVTFSIWGCAYAKKSHLSTY